MNAINAKIVAGQTYEDLPITTITDHFGKKTEIQSFERVRLQDLRAEQIEMRGAAQKHNYTEESSVEVAALAGLVVTCLISAGVVLGSSKVSDFMDNIGDFLADKETALVNGAKNLYSKFKNPPSPPSIPMNH